MKKLLILTMTILSFVGLNVVSADIVTDSYALTVYDNYKYDLITGQKEYDELYSITTMNLIGNYYIDDEIDLSSQNFHHILFFNNYNAYLGYANTNASTLELSTHLSDFDITGNVITFPVGATKFALMTYNYEEVRDGVAYTYPSIDEVAYNGLTYRQIFENSNLYGQTFPFSDSHILYKTGLYNDTNDSFEGIYEYELGKNLIDAKQFLADLYLNTGSGAPSSYDLYSAYSNQKLYLTENTQYVLTMPYNARLYVMYYNSSDDYITSNYVGIGTEQSFTTTTGYDYVKISLLDLGNSEDMTHITGENIQLELGSTATAYEPYQELSHIDGRTDMSSIVYDTATASYLGFLSWVDQATDYGTGLTLYDIFKDGYHETTTNNLILNGDFNEYTTTTINTRNIFDGVIDRAGGFYSDSGYWNANSDYDSYYIDVNASTTYTKTDNIFGGIVTFWTQYDVFISSTNTDLPETYGTFTTPPNTAWISVSVPVLNAGLDLQIEAGVVETAYIPYEIDFTIADNWTPSSLVDTADIIGGVANIQQWTALQTGFNGSLRSYSSLYLDLYNTHQYYISLYNQNIASVDFSTGSGDYIMANPTDGLYSKIYTYTGPTTIDRYLFLKPEYGDGSTAMEVDDFLLYDLTGIFTSGYEASLYQFEMLQDAFDTIIGGQLYTTYELYSVDPYPLDNTYDYIKLQAEKPASDYENFVYDITSIFQAGNEPSIEEFETMRLYYERYKAAPVNLTYHDIFGLETQYGGANNLIYNGTFDVESQTSGVASGFSGWPIDGTNGVMFLQDGMQYIERYNTSNTGYIHTNQAVNVYTGHKYYVSIEMKPLNHTGSLTTYYAFSNTGLFDLGSAYILGQDNDDSLRRYEFITNLIGLDDTHLGSNELSFYANDNLTNDSGLGVDNYRLYDLTAIIGDVYDEDITEEMVNDWFNLYTDPYESKYSEYFNASHLNSLSVSYDWDDTPPPPNDVTQDIEDGMDSMGIGSAIFKFILSVMVMVGFALGVSSKVDNPRVIILGEIFLLIIFTLLGWLPYAILLVLILLIVLLMIRLITRGT